MPLAVQGCGRILPVVFCCRGLLRPPAVGVGANTGPWCSVVVAYCTAPPPSATTQVRGGMWRSPALRKRARVKRNTHQFVCVCARERLVQDTCLCGVLCACRTRVPTQCGNMQHAHPYFTARHRWSVTDTVITHSHRERAAGEWSCVRCLSLLLGVSVTSVARVVLLSLSPSTPIPFSLPSSVSPSSLPPSFSPSPFPPPFPLPPVSLSLFLSPSLYLSLFLSIPSSSLPANYTYGLRGYWNSVHFFLFYETVNSR